MRIAPTAVRLAIALAVFLLQACDQPTAPAPRREPGTLQGVDLTDLPDFDPANFVPAVTNRYFPLVPGTTFRYRSETDEGVEINTVEVTHDAKTILGIAATVVHDQVFLDGELTEDTFDWYAQDKDGNVWYLGEDTRELEDGEVVSTEGSWEAGVDGAEPGIIMWGDPAAHVGENYRQEFLEGEAEDVASVAGVDATADVPFGHFTGCLETIDWSLLEDVPPGEREHKFYCPGVGLVLEAEGPAEERVTNELQTITSAAGAPTVDLLQAVVLPAGNPTGLAAEGGVWLRVRLRDPGDAGPWNWTIEWGEGAPTTLTDLRRSGEFVFLRQTPYTDAGPHTITITVTDSGGLTSVPATATVP